MIRKKYIYLLIIILTFLFFTNNNLKAETLTSLRQICKTGENGGITPSSDDLYNNNGNLKVYEMLLSNGNLLYCLQPGRHAFSGGTYTISDEDKYLAQAAEIGEDDVYTGTTIKKIKVAKQLISYIYGYQSGDRRDDMIVARQIVLWHYMNLIKRAKIPAVRITKVSDLAKDADAIITGAGKKTEKLIEAVNKNFVGNIMNIINEADINFNYYIPNKTFCIDGATYDPASQQILIGPWFRIIENPGTYNVIYRFYSPTGSSEGSKTIASGVSFTNGSGSHEAPTSYPYTYNSKEATYTLSGSGVGTESSARFTSLTNPLSTTTNGATLVFDFVRNRYPSIVTVNHNYTNSSGSTTSKDPSDSNSNVTGSTCEVNAWYKDYFIECKSAQGGSAYLDSNGKIQITGLAEGATYTFNAVYKSKSIDVKYLAIDETGKKSGPTSMSTKSSGEISLGSSYTFTVDPKWTTTINGSNIEYKYLGCKYNGTNPSTTYNWNTTSFTNGSNERKVYEYIIYYENRDLYKYMKDKNGNDLNENLYEKKGTAYTNVVHHSLVDFVFSNPNGGRVDNYFPFTLFGNGNKYVYDNNCEYKFATRTTTEGTSYSDRKSDATSDLTNATKYAYSNQSNRIIQNLSTTDGLVHSDTTIAYFYYDIEEPVYVYVRHVLVDDDGSYKVSTASNISFLKNDDEKYYDSVVAASDPTKQYKVIKNGYNQRQYHSNKASYTDPIPTGFSEYYTIDKNDRLYLDKSRTLLNNGIQYKFLGCRTRNNPEEIPELNKAGDLTKITSAKLIRPSSANSKIYVDFYYTKDGYSDPDNPPEDPEHPPEDPPRTRLTFLQKKADAILKFQSQNSSGNALGADTTQVAYVPASEYIKPYFETASYIPYNLKYKISVDGKSGKITYGLKEYEAYQFDSNGGTVTSSEVVGFNNENVINSGNTKTKNIVQSTASDQKKFYTDLGIYNEKIPIGTKTTIDNFDGNKDVSSNRYNGYRDGDGTVKYILKDVMTGATKSGKDRTLKVVDSMDVNVYTPMSIDKPTIETTGSYVDHSVGIGEDKSVIQKDTEFKLTPKVIINEKLEYNSNLRKLDNYLKGYIVVFDFDVRIKGESGTTNAGTPIWVNKDDSLYATPVGERGSTAVNQLKEKVTTIAVTINEQGLVNSVFGIGSLSTNSKGDITKCKEALTKSGSDVVIGSGKTAKMTTNNLRYNYETYGRTMNADAFYFVKNTTYTYVLARLYDFKITDCYDVNFKNVFRTFDKANGTVNGLTNVCFYSGKNKLVVAGGNNIIYTRAQNTILPIGPYKHTQRDYIKAPKLGYRISFDVKTYGYYDNQTEGLHREVKITPSYYYISKDGTTYNDNIKLYYKNSSGKYVTFNDSYSIAFKPNDGYRNQYNNGDLLDDSTPNDDFLSTKMVNLSVGNSFTLSPDTMMTTSNDKFIQAWYGEFKVPNSTIVVDANNIDLNNPLTDGYLGVIFKIECIDTETSGGTTTTVKVLYDQDDKAKGSNNHNTSQWDYEGYMGSNSGTNFNGSLQLENGKWSINDSTYQKIKGTVVLYDLDDRAANDFD